MNERIKEILSQCQLESIDGPEYPRWTDLEKFAELIVRDCMKMCDEVHRDYGMASDTARITKRYIKKHFGVKE